MINVKAVKKKQQIRHKKYMGEQIQAYLFLLPAIILFLLFRYYPIIEGFFISFFDIDIIHLPGKFSGFKNYVRAFSDPGFYNALGNNIRYVLYSILMTFWEPIVLAIMINEVKRGKTFYRMLYFLPAVAPGIAVAVLFRYIWQPDYGLANYIINFLGLPSQLWLNDVKQVYFCLNFPGMLLCGGMTMVIYLAAMQDVPQEQYEAAMLEGAGFFKRTWSIMLPQISNIIISMLILTIIAAFNEINKPMVMTGGGPAGSTESMIYYAYKQATDYLDYSYAIAMANIVFVIIFIVTAIQMKFQNND